jgi:O-antigen/teichoic acid export membrane protein
MTAINEYRFYPTIKFDLIRKLALFSLSNYIGSILENFPSYLLPLIILNMLGPEDNAYFSIAWAFSILLMSVPKSAALSLFAEGSHDPVSLTKNTTKAMIFVLIMMIPALIIIILFGNNILLIFGKQYSQNAYLILVLFVLGGIPYSFNSFFISMKRVKKEIKAIIIIYSAIALVYISTSYLFINKYGLVGTGYSWILTQSFIAFMIILIWAYQRYTGIKDDFPEKRTL